MEAKCTGGKLVGGSNPNLNLKECACLGGSCPLGEIDKADTWFSLRYSPAYNEMLWKQNVQAVRMGEVQAISSTLRSVYALQADVC